MEKDLNLNEIPAGSLVTEHRLVERYLQLMKRETIRIDRGKSPDRVLTERIIDFFKTYAHRCHYGKEEEILFHRLYSKRLSPEHKRVIDELVLEHIRERELIDRLEIAKDKFWLGDSGALTEILTTLKGILKFYPGHMQREGINFKAITSPGMTPRASTAPGRSARRGRLSEPGPGAGAPSPGKAWPVWRGTSGSPWRALPAPQSTGRRSARQTPSN